MFLFGFSTQHTGPENTRGLKPTLFELFSDLSRELKAGVLAHFRLLVALSQGIGKRRKLKAGVLAHLDTWLPYHSFDSWLPYHRVSANAGNSKREF
jgi:hypothetical protein